MDVMRIQPRNQKETIQKQIRSTVAIGAALAFALAAFTPFAWGQPPPPPQQQQYPQQQYPQQSNPQQPYPSQQPYPPPSYPPQELDRLVGRVALYPDPLLSQIFAAATFPDQIPPAAQWSDQHHYLTGDALAAGISAEQLPWDSSV